METINVSNSLMASMPGAQDASKTKANTNNSFFWMLNKYKRKVPVDARTVADRLAAGYIHTDGEIHSDDMSTRVARAQPAPSSSEVLADLAGVLKKTIKETPEETPSKFEFNGKEYKTEAAMKTAITKSKKDDIPSE